MHRGARRRDLVKAGTCVLDGRARTARRALEAIGTATKLKAGAGEWIRVVGGWHPCQFPENREPTRAELDAIAPDHPVYVQALYEVAVLNSAALRAAGLDAATADPPGGRIERDPASGELMAASS